MTLVVPRVKLEPLAGVQLTVTGWAPPDVTGDGKLTGIAVPLGNSAVCAVGQMICNACACVAAALLAGCGSEGPPPQFTMNAQPNVVRSSARRSPWGELVTVFSGRLPAPTGSPRKTRRLFSHIPWHWGGGHRGPTHRGRPPSRRQRRGRRWERVPGLPDCGFDRWR